MDALTEQLDKKFHEWSDETAQLVRREILQIIELADREVLDISRSRSTEQEVLDILDGPATR